MSVINKMLQDLEKRQRDPSAPVSAKSASASSPDSAKRRRIVMLVLLGVLIIGLLVTYFYQQQLLTSMAAQPIKTIQFDAPATQTASPVVDKTPEVLPNPPVNPPVVEVVPEAPAPIELLSADLLFTPSAQTLTQLKIVLADGLAQYQLNKLSDEWQIQLPNVQMDPSVIAPSYPLWDESSIRLQPSAQGVELHISPVAYRVQVEMLQQRRALLVSIERDAPKLEASAIPTSSPKTTPAVVVSDLDKKADKKAEPKIDNKTAPSKPVYWKAREAFNRQDYAQAENYVLQALEHNAHDKASITLLAQIWLEQGRFQQVLHWLQSHRALYQDIRLIQKLMARAHIGLQQWPQAEQSLNDAPNPQESEWLALMALVYSQQHKAAQSLYRQLMTLEPQQAKWAMALAIELDKQQDYPQAVHYYRQALGIGNLSASSQGFCQQRLSQLAAYQGVQG